MGESWLRITSEKRDPETLRREEHAYGGLAADVRQLINATLRTQVGIDEVNDVAEEVRRLTERLLANAREGSLGLQMTSDGRLRDHGNAATGLRNPIAPPLKIKHDRENIRSRTEFVLGPGYEGPPGHVHGGIIAMILDQICGMIPMLRGRPGMTAYLNITYKRPTPLGPLSAEAWMGETGDWRTMVHGHMLDAEGRVTAEAEGLFVVPRKARERFSVPQSDAGEFELSYPVEDPSDAG